MRKAPKLKGGDQPSTTGSPRTEVKGIGEIWLEHLRRSEEQRPSCLGPDSPSFVDYAWKQFDPKTVIEILLRDEPSYFAHKEILFAGLSAWTVAPNLPLLGRHAMVLAGMKELARVERRSRKRLPGAELFADIVARLHDPGMDYYRDFYYPVGGLTTLIDAGSSKMMARSLATASKDIQYVVAIMRVLHFHAERLQENSIYRRASLKSTGLAVSNYMKKLKLKGAVDPTNTIRYYNQFRKSTALIYAAQSIAAEGEESLLDLMRRGKATFADDGKLIGEWIGRARFAANSILKPMYDRASLKAQTDFLPAIPATSIPLPEFTQAEIDAIESAFARAGWKRNQQHFGTQHKP